MVDTNQIETISKRVIDECKEHGGTISISDVFKIISMETKLILDKQQASFVAAHGVKFAIKGRNIIIRPLAPRDRSRFLDGIHNLSNNTLFLRFLSPVKELSSSQVDYLLNVDFDDHFALGVVEDKEPYPGMAIARYIRSYDNPLEAEWAVTVVDAYQGLGLGRVLLYAISKIAYVHGVRVLTATIHPSNQRILSWMAELKAKCTLTEDGRVWKFQLPIPTSFLNNPSIRDEIQRIVDGKGNLPVCLAADMNDEAFDKMMKTI
ncbi:hypothetical protein WA556_007049 [Blastocystis sp. ATCC 50177/Nand II]